MAFRWSLFQEAASAWSRHNAPRLGAALAYYTVLSLAPFLVLTVAVLGHAFGPAAVRGEVYWGIKDAVGTDGAAFVQTLLQSAYRPGSGAVANAAGFVVLFFGASGVFVELRDTLNFIWNAPAGHTSGIRGLMRHRFFSFVMVLGIGLLLTVSLALSTAAQMADSYLAPHIALPAAALDAINFTSTFTVTAALFALIYRFIPEVPISWGDVATGSVVTAALCAAGKSAIGFYLRKAAAGSAYGATGSLVALLLWAYYLSQIFLYGAEFTHVHAQYRRSCH